MPVLQEGSEHSRVIHSRAESRAGTGIYQNSFTSHRTGREMVLWIYSGEQSGKRRCRRKADGGLIFSSISRIKNLLENYQIINNKKYPKIAITSCTLLLHTTPVV